MDPTTAISPASLAMSTNSMSPDPVLKMEDFALSSPHSLSATKPVKKRKSWGQELPEPKTTLPPRKRAKTDDEKEQRRIERIKRNRAAAHNSRERKRVEAEHLAVNNNKLITHINELRSRLALREAQLAKCKELLPDGLPEVSAHETSLYNIEMNDSCIATPSSAHTIDPRDSFVESTPATSPADTSHSKLEDSDIFSLVPSVPSEVQTAGNLDPTQHSAVSVEPRQSSAPTIGSVNTPSLVDSANTTPYQPQYDDFIQNDTPGLLDDFSGAHDFAAPLDSFEHLFDFSSLTSQGFSDTTLDSADRKSVV